MATNRPRRPAPTPNSSVIGWLLDSDPAIRWQVLRDLTNARASYTPSNGKWAVSLWGRNLGNSDYVIATGRPVLYLGGFNGVDQVVSGDDLARLVAEGKLRYIYWGGGEGGPGGGRGPGPGGAASLSTWVTAHCTPVEGFETETSNFGAPDGITSYSSAVSSSRGMQVALYDCGN